MSTNQRVMLTEVASSPLPDMGLMETTPKLSSLMELSAPTLYILDPLLITLSNSNVILESKQLLQPSINTNPVLTD